MASGVESLGGADTIIGRMGRFLVGALLIGVIFPLAGCGLLEESYDLRYKLTIEVDTPQGVRTGSGVIQRSVILHPIYSIGPQTDARVKGEAVPIDLPNGETIFALLGGPGKADYAWDLPRRLFLHLIAKPEFKGDGRTYYDLKKQNDYLVGLKPGATLVGDDMPLMVRFKDIRNPLSIERVDPADFSKSFGPGYRLRRVTMQVTDDPVTYGISRKLPWLDQIETAAIDGTEFPSNDELKSNIGVLAFKRKQ